ncbi:MAG: glycoside hydrolase family 71/99 protein [Saccharofermentanales bacterium]
MTKKEKLLLMLKSQTARQIALISLIMVVAVSVIAGVALSVQPDKIPSSSSSDAGSNPDSIENRSGESNEMTSDNLNSSQLSTDSVNQQGSSEDGSSASSSVLNSQLQSASSSQLEPTVSIPANSGSEVGIWYSTWYAKLDPSIPGYTTENRNPKFDTWIGWNILYRPLGPTGAYETYDAKDEAVLTYHIKEMAAADIDFIIMDQTNHIDIEGGYINARSIKMAQTIKKWNDNPANKPLRYSSAIGEFQFTGDPASIEKEAKTLYMRYNSQNFSGPKYHYYLDGKPLLVVYAGNIPVAKWTIYTGSKEYADKFTIRWASNDSTAGYYGWAYNRGSVYDEEAVVVMPGWRNNAGNPPVLRDHGAWYEASWDVVLKAAKKPKIVIINSFNEYAERTAVWTADTSGLTGSPNGLDRWVDEDGVLDPDMYWNMTVEKIKEYKRMK